MNKWNYLDCDRLSSLVLHKLMLSDVCVWLLLIGRGLAVGTFRSIMQQFKVSCTPRGQTVEDHVTRPIGCTQRHW